MSNWKKYGETLPPFGEEVLAYNSKWIDEDFNEEFNPTGIRVGFRTESEETGSNGFKSAKWVDYQDDYISSDSTPEYWTEIPNFKLKEDKL